MFTTQHKSKIKFVSGDKRVFYSTLKNRVDAYFQNNQKSRHANWTMVSKTILLLICYLVPLALVLWLNLPFWACIPLFILAGIGKAGIGMSVMHDAVHGAYTSNERLNRVIGYVSLNMLGASVQNWRIQHNVLHHTFTNIAHLDEDITDKGGLRFSPHTELKNGQQFQWFYAFFIYGLTTLYWVIAKDFSQIARYIKNEVVKRDLAINTMTIVKIALVKILYFCVFLILPIWAGYHPGVIIGGFLIMHFVSGVVLTVVFQLAHTVEGTSHPLPDAKGNIENDWAIHQMNTTVNFSRKNKWLSWYVGGLNFQVEHHLFPRICHVHYPKIAHIVQSTAQEFGVPYLVNETFWDAFQSHVRTLQRFGTMPSLEEAIG